MDHWSLPPENDQQHHCNYDAISIIVDLYAGLMLVLKVVINCATTQLYKFYSKQLVHMVQHVSYLLKPTCHIALEGLGTACEVLYMYKFKMHSTEARGQRPLVAQIPMCSLFPDTRYMDI